MKTKGEALFHRELLVYGAVGCLCLRVVCEFTFLEITNLLSSLFVTEIILVGLRLFMPTVVCFIPKLSAFSIVRNKLLLVFFVGKPLSNISAKRQKVRRYAY